MESLAYVTLDMQNPALAVVVYAKQNDRLSRKIVAQLVDGSATWSVPNTASGIIRYQKPDGTTGFYDTDEASNPAVVVSGSIVTLTLAEQALTVAGDVYMELNFYDGTGAKLTTFTWILRVQESVLPDSTVVSSSYYNVLTTQITSALQAAEDAEAAAEAAQSASAGTVHWDTAQTLTAAQQAQARTNIGAINAAEAPVQSVNGAMGAVIVPNGNLLVNWDMKNLINSRNAAPYSTTAEVYTFDMWKSQYATLTTHTGYVNFTSKTNMWSSITQVVPGPFPAGATFTLSLHCKVNSYTGGSLQLGQLVSNTSTVLHRAYFSATGDQVMTVTADTTSSADSLFVTILVSDTTAANVDMYEWKLEQGGVSTLIPGECADYTEQKIRCAQYLQIIKTGSLAGVGSGFITWETPKKARVGVPITSMLSKRPTITITDSGTGTASYGSVYFSTSSEAGTAITILGESPGLLFISVTLPSNSAAQQNMPCVWTLSSTETCVLSWEP